MKPSLCGLSRAGAAVVAGSRHEVAFAKQSLGGAAGWFGAAAALENAALTTRPGSPFPSPALGRLRFLDGCNGGLVLH